MKKILILSLFLISSISFAQDGFTGLGGRAGAFSRAGYGARGIGMGNSMSSVVTGNMATYYNPALSVFQEGNSIQLGYSFLNLDRSLNFLNFVRKFEFGKNSKNKKLRSTAGVSVGIINSGVTGIEERDNQGVKTGDISTSENQFFLSLANKFSSKLSMGISFKLYYYKLYEDISASNIGFDVGLVYKLMENLFVSGVLTDLNAKYAWDTTDLYGQDGNNIEDKFPLSKKIGMSYYFKDPALIISAEYENLNVGVNYIRFGTEYNIFEGLHLRAGIDKINLSNSDFPIRPSFGFSYIRVVNNWALGIDYAFMVEPYSDSDKHVIGINFNL